MCGFLFCISCHGKKTQKSIKVQRTPDRIFTQAHILYKASGELKMDIRAPVVEQYQFKNGKSQKLFPKGVRMIFYEKNQIKPSYLKADWAEEIEQEDLCKAKGHVEIITSQGDTLQTDEIVWKKAEKKIYTQTLTEIHRADGAKLIAKNGLEGSEDLTEITLKNTEGIIPVKQENSP